MRVASSAEQLALQSSIREWAKRSGAIDVVRCQEPSGADAPGAAQRWASLAELGLFTIGLPPLAGGAGGTAVDRAAALAQVTESLVAGPVMPTLLAGSLLADCQACAVGQQLPRLAAGEISVAVAFGPGSLVAQPQRDGNLLVSGRVGPVLGAGSSTHVLLGATRQGASAEPPDTALWFLVSSEHPGIRLTERMPADFSRSLGDVSADAAVISPAQILAALTTERVRDLAAALGAVEGAAVAAWCSRTAAEYAAIRHQFGRPIGSFQAIKHMCAEMACRAEIAATLAIDAAAAMDDQSGELRLAAAIAAGYVLDAAVANAKDCIQVLGGIGFTWEHDAHLYLRRALSLRQLLGRAEQWRIRAAELAIAGGRRRQTAADAGNATDDVPAVKEAARAVAAAVANLPAAEQRGALVDSGYAAPEWPPPYGLGVSSAVRLVIDDELSHAGLSRPDIGIGEWAIPAILGHGCQDQQQRFAGPTLRGEIAWCQLFSEPEAGSDLASLRTRAERVQGGWLLTGQKVWTSLATEADWAICLARTDSSVPKHKGITYFLVSMASPGIEIRPLREITGRQMFNQVFLDQVFVPDDCVVGEPGEGWRITRTTLSSERVAMGAGSSVGAAVEDLLALAGRLGAADDEVAKDRLGSLVAEGMAIALLDRQAVLAQLRGEDAGPRAAVRKLVGVRHRQAVAEAALELSGPDGAAADHDAAALVHQFLLTRCLSIAGGSTQILLSLIGERLLGLPREETR